MKRTIFILLTLILLILNCSFSQANTEYDKYIYKKHKKESFFTKFINQFKDKPFDASYAIIIAIGDYDHLNRLKYANKDADKMKYFLRSNDHYDEIVILNNEDASYENIRYFMECYFPYKMSKGERYRLLFYFTGHGKYFKDYNDKPFGQLLLKRSKGTIEDLNMIDMDRIQYWLKKMNSAVHVLFLLDCCFSGLAGVQEMCDYDSSINAYELAMRSGRHMITGGSDVEKTISGDQWGGSLFTEMVINGMKGQGDSNDDNIVTFTELFNYVYATVNNEARKIGYKQTPNYCMLGSSQDNGQYFFIYDEVEKSDNYQDNAYHGEVLILKDALIKLRGDYENAITHGKTSDNYKRVINEIGEKPVIISNKLNNIPDYKLDSMYKVVKSEYCCYGYGIAAIIEEDKEKRLKHAEEAIKSGKNAIKLIQDARSNRYALESEYYKKDDKENRIKYILAICYSIKYADHQNKSDMVIANMFWNEIDNHYKGEYPPGFPQLKKTVKK